LTAWIEQAAAEANVPLQRATSIGYAVTDAAAIHLRRDGIPTGVLGLARRYSHTPICMFDLNDGVSAVALLERFVAAMGSHRDLGFL
jgi:putative aminopeptidase FrvX